MPNYKAMYFALAAQVANATDLLIAAQQAGEESAIADDDDCTVDDAAQPTVLFHGASPHP